MLAAINYPAWLRPEIIPGLPFRWYGLMYVVAFAVTWFLFRYESKRRNSPWNDDIASGFFLWAIVGLIIGARLFGTLVYDPSRYYWTKPWLIFWPFDGNGRFSGFQGMSFHGGFVGLIVATLIYSKKVKVRWMEWGDVIAVSAPLGYTAGRLGNFINGELWGKVTDAPWGMIFPTVPESGRFPASEAWVREAAEKAGIDIWSMNDLINLPRHPSQLYEALFEGVVLWLFLWFLVRKRKSFPGLATGLYAIGYGLIRFIIEYFREPDVGIGYILGDRGASIHRFSSVWNFSMGQALCAGMILAGIAVLLYGSHGPRPSLLSQAQSLRAEGPRAAAAGKAAHDARKLRKKIR